MRAQSLLAAGAAVAVTITALSVEHFHAAHASGPKLALGDALRRDGDRTTNIASNED